MQFIDINCMIGEWAFSLKFKSAVQLQDEMRRLNICRSFVFHSRSWLYDVSSGNEAIVCETGSYKNLVPVISLTSLTRQEFKGGNAIIDFITANGVGAVRLFPNDHNYTMNIWNIDKLFGILNEMRLPVLFECRPMEGAAENSFQQLYEIARTYGNTPIILVTTGYRSLRTIYGLFDKCRNIYMDTSTFITFRGIEDVVGSFGAERILFGTRMPFIEAGASIGRIIYADISSEEKHRIAYGNAMDLIQSMPWIKMQEETMHEA